MLTGDGDFLSNANPLPRLMSVLAFDLGEMETGDLGDCDGGGSFEFAFKGTASGIMSSLTK